MPFAKRIVQPVKVSRGPIGEEYRFDLDIHSNTTLCGALRQLASLAKKADDIFDEIALEFVQVASKTERLRSRVHDLGKHVNKLDAKAVKIPVSDLATFVEERDHYRAEHGYDQALFTKASRPPFLQDTYESVEPSPIKAIRRCNTIRTDGQRGSRIFSPQLIVNEKGNDEIDVDVALRKPVILTPCEKEYKELKEPKVTKRPKSVAVFTELDISTNKDVSLLPTPEEKQREMSRSQPVTLVPIDVTGQGFQRLCEYRASIRSMERVYVHDESTTSTKSMRKKSRRRQTISGIPGHIYDEVVNGYSTISSVRTRSASRDRWERPKSMGLDEYVPGSKDRSCSPGRRARSKERKQEKAQRERDGSPFSRSCSLRRSFKSLFKDKRSKSTDLWAEGRPESPDPFLVDFGGTLRRARSLPRSLKSMRESNGRLNGSRSAEGMLECWSEEEDKIGSPPPVRGKPPRPVGPGSFLRIRRSQSQGSSLRASQILEGRVERPQSLDIFPPQPIPVVTPTTPSCSSSRMNIIPGQPAWAAFAADVRLRTRTGDKTPREECHSSSGHWSGSSSSARVSLESEYNRMLQSPDRHSQTSLDKDSALSLNIHSSSTSEERYDTTDNNPDNGEETSTVTGDASTMIGDNSTINGDDDRSSAQGSVIDVKNNFTKMNSEDWLNSLKKEKQRRDFKQKHGLSSASSSDSMQMHGLTRLALQAHDSVHKPLTNRTSYIYDEESSVYSVDQEGFYTSMHKDSGLKRAHGDILEEEAEFAGVPVSPSESESTVSTRGARPERSKRRSLISGLPSFRKSGRKQRKPPPPPPRGSTQLDKKSNVSFTIQVPQSLPKSSTPPGSNKENITPNKNNDSSESDAENIYARLKTKTSISSAAFPSMCSVTPIQSDEEDGEMLDFKQSWRPGDYSSLKSIKSAPGEVAKIAMTSTPVNKEQPVKSGSSQATTPSSSATTPDSVGSVIAMDGCSTWPRSPLNKGDKKVSRFNQGLSPTINMLEPENEEELMDSNSLMGPQRSLCLPNQGSTNSIGQGSEHSSGRQSSSLMSYPPSQSSSSIPSSISEDNPTVPSKYQHTVTVKPGQKPSKVKPPVPIRENSLKQGKTTSESNNKSHIYASVVINNNNASGGKPQSQSMLKTFAPINKRFSVAMSTPVKDPQQTEFNMSTWPRKAKSSHTPVKSLVSDYDSPVGSVHSEPVEHKLSSGQLAKVVSIPVTKPYTGPVAAPAKLIISSPVATKVSFKENPYKRSVCSPVTSEELKAFCNPIKEGVMESKMDSVITDKEVAHQQAMASTPLTQPLSKPLFPDLVAMKHSITFPVETRNCVSPTYGKSWYEGIDSYAKESSPPASSVITTTAGYFSMQPRCSFSSQSREQSPAAELLPYESRRDSIASSTSTESGGKPKPFASIKKASPASSLGSLKMDGGSILLHTETIAEDERVPTFSSFTKPPINTSQRPMSFRESSPARVVVHSRPLSLRETSPAPGVNLMDGSQSPAVRPTHLPLNNPEPSAKKIKVEDKTEPAAKPETVSCSHPESSMGVSQTIPLGSLASPAESRHALTAPSLNLASGTAISTTQAIRTRPTSVAVSVSSAPNTPTVTIALTTPIVTNALTTTLVSSTLTTPTVTSALTTPIVTNALTIPLVSSTAATPVITSAIATSIVSGIIATPVITIAGKQSCTTTPVISSKMSPVRVSYKGTNEKQETTKRLSSFEPRKPLLNINISPSKPKPPSSYIPSKNGNTSPMRVTPPKDIVKAASPPQKTVTEVLPDHKPVVMMSVPKEPTPTRELVPPRRNSRSSVPRETPPRESPTKELEKPMLTITGETSTWNGATSPPVETKTLQPPPLLSPESTHITSKPPLARRQSDSTMRSRQNSGSSENITFNKVHQRKASTGSENGVSLAPLSVYNGLNKSLCSLSAGASVSNNNLASMSGSINSLYKSATSLAKSTDSINSNSSAHVERNRASKMAFLATADTSPVKPPSDPFAKFKLGKSKTPERDSDKNNIKSVEKTKHSEGSPKSPKSPDRPGAVQGRFVSSMIDQLHRKSSIDSVTSSASHKSSSSPSSTPTSRSPQNSPRHLNGSLSPSQRATLKTLPVS